ncbi:hypothetical protein ADEAN_000496900 [Angomonas deanei]|uniref:Uncharacterized protein n=1 Tax=Angomonas deanei TaxID=59799 RepID=A0A7G2CET6_9TRYP|nr:hypothetical protein ADEAN_000496900 [Angomonas deanei]
MSSDNEDMIDYNDVSRSDVVAINTELISEELSSMRLQGGRVHSADNFVGTKGNAEADDYKEDLDKSRAILQYMASAEVTTRSAEGSYDRFETFIAAPSDSDTAKKKQLSGFQPI